MISFRPAILLFGALLSCASLSTALAAEAPLEGVAWEQADLAYRSYQLGRYRDALQQVDAALKLRPEVARLNLLKVYTLQKLGRRNEAGQAAQTALKRGVQSVELRAAVENLKTAPAAGQSPSTAFQRGFPYATKAFAAYNANDMVSAARDAETAFRADPSQGLWAMLWINAQEAQQHWNEAVHAVDTAIALGAPNVTDLQARSQSVKRRMAERPTLLAYQALIAGRPGEAAGLAREAVELAPDVANQRLLLVTALIQDKQYAAAEQATDDALEENDENTVMLGLRAYLRQLQGNADAARADFDEALAQDWLDESQLRNLRLIAIDGALAGAEPQRAEQLLSPLAADDEAANKRRKLLASGKKAPATLTTVLYPPPVQACQDTPYGTQCELLPSDTLNGPAGPASGAYAAYGRQDFQEAITLARQATQQAPENVDFQRLLTTTLAAGDAQQTAEAEQRLNAALGNSPNDADLLIQRGNLYQLNRQPSKALRDFRAARETGKAPPSVVLNEGYALAATGNNPGGVAKLKQGIDMADAGRLELDDTQRYNTRSAITGLDREWGATVSLGFRGSQPTSNINGAGLSTAGDTVSSTTELFWRPTEFNSQKGMLEVYGRLSNTLYDEGSEFESKEFVDPCTGSVTVDSRSRDERLNGSSSVTGIPSTIGSLGVRYMLNDTGLTFGLERRFYLGSGTREGTAFPASRDDQCRIQQAIQDANEDGAAINGLLTRYKLDSTAGGWLTYMTYGFYQGTELRLNESQWFTMDGFAQLGYAWENNDAKFTTYDVDSQGSTTRQLGESSGQLKRQQVFASTELRVGRSMRVDALPGIVFFPHLVGAADWLWQKDRASDMHFSDTDLIKLSQIGNDWSLTSEERSWSIGAGPGLSIRYWFREDHYHAPRSSLNWSMQYRVPIGGGATERAKGLFMNLTLSY